MTQEKAHNSPQFFTWNTRCCNMCSDFGPVDTDIESQQISCNDQWSWFNVFCRSLAKLSWSLIQRIDQSDHDLCAVRVQPAGLDKTPRLAAWAWAWWHRSSSCWILDQVVMASKEHDQPALAVSVAIGRSISLDKRSDIPCCLVPLRIPINWADTDTHQFSNIFSWHVVEGMHPNNAPPQIVRVWKRHDARTFKFECYARTHADSARAARTEGQIWLVSPSQTSPILGFFRERPAKYSTNVQFNRLYTDCGWCHYS